MRVGTPAVPGERSPETYVDEILAGRLREPVVNMYLKLGFQPIGLIPNCMESDEESANYGLAMLKEIEEREP